MMTNTPKEKLFEFRGKTRKWWQKRGDSQGSKADTQRERHINILQKRYGYTEEKALSELNTHYSKTRFG